jgi:hypothetical protein
MRFRCLLASLCVALGLLSCGGAGASSTSSAPTTPAEVYEYWRGDIPNSFYWLNIYGDRALQVTGKPWMVIKRDPVSLRVLDLEFGLSEVTQTPLANPNNMPSAPYPTISPSYIDYASRLGLDLTKPAALCVRWQPATNLVNGVQNISFTHGGSASNPTEQWNFSFLTLEQWGGVKNLDTYAYLGSDSDTNAFRLMKL